MKPNTFKNGEEFTRYIEGLTGKPFKAAASTDGTTAHKYLTGQRDHAKLFTDPDLKLSWGASFNRGSSTISNSIGT